MIARCASTCVVVLLTLAGACLGVDGISVTSMYRQVSFRNIELGPERRISGDAGRIVRYYIDDNQVTSHDTLSDRIVNTVRMNPEGTLIAYWYRGKRLIDNKLVDDKDGCYISTMDIDGNNVQDLVKTPCPGSYPQLDFPLGGYVYYQKEDPANGEIWRVNVNDPTDHELVCDLVDKNSSDNQKYYLHRFNLSSNVKYAASRRWASPFAGGWMGNWCHAWPPQDCNPTKESTGQIPGCNNTISVTGKYVAYYNGGSHGFIFVDINNWNSGDRTILDYFEGHKGGIDIKLDILTWMGDTTIQLNGGNWPNWSTNSDKWFIQRVGIWQNKGSLGGGTQQVISNFIDKDAFIPTNNPVIDQDADMHYASEAGDFWVKPPTGMEGCLETDTGNWVDIDGKDCVATNARRDIRVRKVLPQSGNISVYTPRGRLVERNYGGSAGRNMGRGVYIEELNGKAVPSVRW